MFASSHAFVEVNKTDFGKCSVWGPTPPVDKLSALVPRRMVMAEQYG